MMIDGGYTKGYTPRGVVHKSEWIVPRPFNYPKWWVFVRRLVPSYRFRNWGNLKFGKYNPDKDVFKALTGKEFPHD